MYMTMSKTEADFIQPITSRIGLATVARRRIRKAVLRYLKWRTVSHLQQVDVHTLRDLGICPAELMLVVRGLEIDDTRRRNKFP